MEDEIKQKIKEDENYQKILNALVSTSSYGVYTINKAGFVNVLASTLSHKRKENIEKISSFLEYLNEKEIIEINNDKIKVNKNALNYATKNLEFFS